MDIIKKGFGEKLKAYRKIKNLTQETLAEKIGINLRQLARIEAGSSFVSSETLCKICSALEISPAFLFDFEIENVLLMTGNSSKMHLSVIKIDNVYKLFSEDKCIVNKIIDKSEEDLNKWIVTIARNINKEVYVDEIHEESVILTKVFKPDGSIEKIYKNSISERYKTLKQNIQTIAHDENRLEFMHLAYDSIYSKESLSKLKILIKGIELTQS